MNVFDSIEESLKRQYEKWSGSSQFEGTARRLERMVGEMCWTLERIEEELEDCFRAVTSDDYDEMLVSGPTSVWTLCPHHLMPCHYRVHIGYIPYGGVLGLSKFSRIAIILAKRPVIQEQYTRELADVLMSKLKPLGVGVHVVGNHGCMSSRGVCQNMNITTSVLRGVMMHNPLSRSEFHSLVRDGSR